MSFEIGERVRWHPTIMKSDWVATVIGHPSPRMVLLDSGPTVSVGLLERVDGMTDEHNRAGELEALRNAPVDPNFQRVYDQVWEIQAKLDAMTAERDALAELVAMQMELIAAPASPPGDSKEREWREKLVRLMNYHFEAIYRSPHWRAMMKADSPLKQLVDHIDKGPR